jgi:hypothetical protein
VVSDLESVSGKNTFLVKRECLYFWCNYGIYYCIVVLVKPLKGYYNYTVQGGSTKIIILLEFYL